MFLGFCSVDFVTSKKTNLEVKIDLPASLWRDSFSGPKRERGFMHSVYETYISIEPGLYDELNSVV